MHSSAIVTHHQHHCFGVYISFNESTPLNRSPKNSTSGSQLSRWAQPGRRQRRRTRTRGHRRPSRSTHTRNTPAAGGCRSQLCARRPPRSPGRSRRLLPSETRYEGSRIDVLQVLMDGSALGGWKTCRSVEVPPLSLKTRMWPVWPCFPMEKGTRWGARVCLDHFINCRSAMLASKAHCHVCACATCHCTDEFRKCRNGILWPV
jgi:hypothetical protein